MSYSGFLLLFVVPPLLLQLVLNRRAQVRGRALPLGLLLAAVYLSTTPWDSWAVRHALWGFDEARLWGARFFGLPLEELLFFGLQALLTGLWVRRRLWGARAEWGLAP
jgi:lycopene cyclase domain-containing protein